MKKADVEAFIRIMKEVAEDWTPEQVEEKYGDLPLKEALAREIGRMQPFFDFAEGNTLDQP